MEPKPQLTAEEASSLAFPLYSCARDNDLESLTKHLATAERAGLARAAVLTERQATGLTPWLVAAWHASSEVLEFLLAEGVPTDDTVGGAAPSQEFRLNGRNCTGASAVHLCTMSGHFPTLHMLLTRGGGDAAARDATGCTPLIVAAQYNRVLCAQLLARHGADVAAVDQLGCSAMHWVAFKDHHEMISLLASESSCAADPAALPEGGSAPLGFEVDARNSQGQTALHLAALSASSTVLLRLLDLGASLSATDKHGSTPAQALAKILQGRTQPEPKTPEFNEWYEKKKCLHLLAPTWQSWINFSRDQAYYLVMVSTAVAYIGYGQVLLATPHQLGGHLLAGALNVAMNTTWQMTVVSDPGTVGMREKDVYAERYRCAIDAMCKSGSIEVAEPGELCHTCRVLRPLRSKHSGHAKKCVPRFDHNCPWVKNAIGYRNHPLFMLYVVCALGALGSTGSLCSSFLVERGGSRWAGAKLYPAVAVSVLICSIFFVGCAILLLFQCHLNIVQNVTTNEYINRSRMDHFRAGGAPGGPLAQRSPFDRGKMANARMLFHLTKEAEAECLACDEGPVQLVHAAAG